jgi:hypothetical protein
MGLEEKDTTVKLGKREFDPIKAESEGLFGKLLKNKQNNRPKKKLNSKRKQFKKVK